MSLEEIINKIHEKTKLPKAEIIQKINNKKKDLSGLITDEGAAYIIAKELGVNVFEGKAVIKHTLTIKDLVPGMNGISITGLVKDVIPVKEFARSNNRKGAVASVTLVDKTGEIRAVFWDEKTRAIKSGNIKAGKVIKIVRGYVKEGRDGNPEINVGSRSAILYPTDTDLENIELKPTIITDFTGLTPNKTISNIIGKVKRFFPITTFTKNDGSEGKVMRVILKGEKGSTILVLWDTLVSMFEGISEGDIIQVKNVYTRENRNGNIELHTTPQSEILTNPEIDVDIKDVQEGDILNLAELTEQLYDIRVIGEVLTIYDKKEFIRSDNTKGFVQSILIRDSTGTARVSFWDDKTEEITKLKVGDIIEIRHAYTRGGEFGLSLNVGSKAEIIINPKGVSIKPPSDENSIKFSELSEGLFNLTVIGRVKQIFDTREFDRSDGTKGKVLSFLLVDETGVIRAVAWGDRVNELSNIKTGDIVLIQGAYTKPSLNNAVEIHLGRSATVTINPPGVELEPLEKLYAEELVVGYPRKKIAELKPQDKAEILGTIVYVYPKNIVYPACPNCYKKVEKIDDVWVCTNCGDLDHVEHRMIFSVTIDDGSGTIRANLIGAAAETLLGISSEEAHNLIESEKETEISSKLQSLVAKTYLFSGKVIFSDFSQDNELNVNQVRPVRAEQEVKQILDEYTDR